MSTLLIQNIRSLVSCDDADTVYENVDLYAKDGFIRAIGKNLPQEAEKVIDASHMFCYPGLVNTHHHLYQQFFPQPAGSTEHGALRLAQNAL